MNLWVDGSGVRLEGSNRKAILEHMLEITVDLHVNVFSHPGLMILTITNPTSIWISILNLWELRQILEFPPHNAIHRERCALVFPIFGGNSMNCFPWVAIHVEKFGKFFSIRKTYFLQVKNLILVGTLEKCEFWSLLILKSYLTCGVGYDREQLIELINK